MNSSLNECRLRWTQKTKNDKQLPNAIQLGAVENGFFIIEPKPTIPMSLQFRILVLFSKQVVVLFGTMYVVFHAYLVYTARLVIPW